MILSIPFIHQKAEIESRKVSISFEGPMRLGEAMAIIIEAEWAIQQRLVLMQLLAKNLEIAREYRAIKIRVNILTNKPPTTVLFHHCWL